MKIKSLAINYLILISQMVVLCTLYLPSIIYNDTSINAVAFVIFAFGIAGGYYLWKTSAKEKKQKGIIAWGVILIGSLVTTLLAYAIILPALIVLTTSTFTALLVILGGLTPTIWFVSENRE